MVKKFLHDITTSYLVFYTTLQFGTLEEMKVIRREKPYSNLDLAKIKHSQSTTSLRLLQS